MRKAKVGLVLSYFLITTCVMILISGCASHEKVKEQNYISWNTHLFNNERTNKANNKIGLNFKPYWTLKLRTSVELLYPGNTPRTSVPAIAGDSAYLGKGKQKFYALDLSKKKVLWRKNTEGYVNAPATTSNDAVYFGTSEGQVYALKRSNGEEIWRFSANSEILSSPLLYGETLFLSTLSDKLFALDVRSGKRLWQHKGRTSRLVRNRLSSSPAGNDGKIFHIYSNGYLVCLDAQTGKKLWDKEVLRATDLQLERARRTPYIAQNKIFIIDNSGEVIEIDKNNGVQLAKHVGSNGDKIKDFLIIDKMILLVGANEIVMKNLDTGNVLWRNKNRHGIPISSFGSKEVFFVLTNYTSKPLIFNMFAREKSRIEAYSLSDGKILFDAVVGVTLSPSGVVHKNYLLFLAEEGYLVVYKHS